MVDTRLWAQRRRMYVLTAIGLLIILLLVFIYIRFIYTVPSCFDSVENGDERGRDCGGSCVRICAFDTRMPTVQWVESFKIIDGQYNAVAYVENPNPGAATPELRYTLRLSDSIGVIAERNGSTILPPDNVYPIFEGRIMTGNRVPTKTTIELEPPELWLPATQARSQFNLVDRGQILNADESPSLQSSLRNNALVPAKDVEIVTTIFDLEGKPLTASRTFADFAPQTVQNIVFTWPEPIATTIRSCEVPTDVILAIDLSGSMNNLGGVPPEPLESVKRAAQSFVNRLSARDRVGLVTFATDASLVTQLSTNPGQVSATIAQLDIDPIEEEGSTNSGAGLETALREFSSDRHNLNARKVLILLTDGLTNEPEPEPEQYALSLAGRLQSENVDMYTIGLGEEINVDFLQAMASDPSKFFTTLSPEQVDRIYRTITEAICEQGAAKIDILPKARTTFPEWP